MEVVAYYELSCRCGRPLRGQRERTRQIIACPLCGRKRFILPKSPWLAPASSITGAQATRLNVRRLLSVIVLGGALAMGLIFLLARPYLRRPPVSGDATATADSHTLLEAGERELREGNVRLALQELNAARARHDLFGDALNREERQHLEQLRRQCDLLARLLDQPLEDIVQQARQHRSDEEWREKFEDYRGRAVVFDDVLRRDARGRPVLGFYVVRAGDTEARIALEDLQLLRQLPLEPPRRWLFGARLADCRREDGGSWVFHFERDSAVLLTDESAAAACCPHPLDKELLAVLKRQDEWLRR
jgi:DNA-directed RNA polymerase subunit RPC12/RpoP